MLEELEKIKTRKRRKQFLKRLEILILQKMFLEEHRKGQLEEKDSART